MIRSRISALGMREVADLEALDRAVEAVEVRVELVDEAVAAAPGVEAAVAVHEAVVERRDRRPAVGQELAVDEDDPLGRRGGHQFRDEHRSLLVVPRLAVGGVVEVSIIIQSHEHATYRSLHRAPPRAA